MACWFAGEKGYEDWLECVELVAGVLRVGKREIDGGLAVLLVGVSRRTRSKLRAQRIERNKNIKMTRNGLYIAFHTALSLSNRYKKSAFRAFTEP